MSALIKLNILAASSKVYMKCNIRRKHLRRTMIEVVAALGMNDTVYDTVANRVVASVGLNEADKRILAYEQKIKSEYDVRLIAKSIRENFENIWDPDDEKFILTLLYRTVYRTTPVFRTDLYDLLLEVFKHLRNVTGDEKWKPYLLSRQECTNKTLKIRNDVDMELINIKKDIESKYPSMVEILQVLQGE